MLVGTLIRENRSRLGLSQDDLAARIYVSRQTISNWETGKTCPDLQSLLLLSGEFGVSVDELLKGDAATMEKSIQEDIRTLNRLSWVTIVFLVLMCAAIAWMGAQLVVWRWEFGHVLPTVLLALVLWGIDMAALLAMQSIEKRRDLVTRREILAFLNGEPVDRDTERGRRIRARSRRMKRLIVAAAVTLGALCGALLGYAYGGALSLLS